MQNYFVKLIDGGFLTCFGRDLEGGKTNGYPRPCNIKGRNSVRRRSGKGKWVARLLLEELPPFLWYRGNGSPFGGCEA